MRITARRLSSEPSICLPSQFIPKALSRQKSRQELLPRRRTLTIQRHQLQHRLPMKSLPLRIQQLSQEPARPCQLQPEHRNHQIFSPPRPGQSQTRVLQLRSPEQYRSRKPDLTYHHHLKLVSRCAIPRRRPHQCKCLPRCHMRRYPVERSSPPLARRL